jgi:hypothetical protein
MIEMSHDLGRKSFTLVFSNSRVAHRPRIVTKRVGRVQFGPFTGPTILRWKKFP